MPYLSDAELGEQLARVERQESSPARSSDDAGLSPIAVLGGLGAAGLVGVLRGKFADKATGEWKVPGSNWDAEAAIVTVLGLIAIGGSHVGLGQYRTMAALGALSVGSHYLGEIGQGFGRTGELKLTVGHGVPPWDTTSFDPTQYAGPHDDLSAKGLGSSGV